MRQADVYLVAHEGGQVAVLGGFIEGERANAPTVVLRALLGQELQGAAAGGLELAVGHLRAAEESAFSVSMGERLMRHAPVLSPLSPLFAGLTFFQQVQVDDDGRNQADFLPLY